MERTRENTEQLQKCNHEEADTRMIYHMAQGESNAAVVVKDADVLILLLYAKSQNLKDMYWYKKINAINYINIDTLYQNFGCKKCSLLPKFHVITGCDTTSCRRRRRKLWTFWKLMKNHNYWQLLNNLGKSYQTSQSTVEDVTRFIQMVIYTGRKRESYIYTNVRL